LGFSLWVAWGKEWPVEGEHRWPVAPAAAAGNSGEVDLRRWLMGGGELRCNLEEALRFLGALEIAEEAAPAASSLAAVADGVGLRPEQGGNDIIGDERRGAGLAVRHPRPREPARTAVCPRPARLTDAADGLPGRARFAWAARGTRHLGMRAAWGRVHGLGKARLGKERRGLEAEVAGRGARGSARAPHDVAFRLRLLRFTLVRQQLSPKF
jgi:hypothetical protein